MLKCLACGRTPDKVQPTYCSYCFIPIPGSQKNHSDRKLLAIRKSNRERFAQEILAKSDAAAEFLHTLGLGHLNPYDLAVSLSAIGQEKLHPMSPEYSWTEAETYLDLGYGLAQHLDSDSLKVLTSQRLAEQLIRGGWSSEVESILDQPEKLGESLKKDVSGEEMGTVLSNLTSFAILQLAKAVMGKEWQREKLMDSVSHLWELMRPEISRIIVQGEARSFTQESTSVPRLDKLAFVQSFTVQAEIASSIDHFTDAAVEALQVLGRMVVILGEMCPKDDPLFYGGVIREYIRLFNGMFWHRTALHENDADTIQTAIVQAHSIIVQWSKLIPPQSWITTRPSRFIEIFFRATRWAELLSPRIFLDYWMKHASKEAVPYIKYFEAEALLNDGQKEEGEAILLGISDLSKADPALQEAVRDLLQRSSLETLGLVLNRPHQTLLPVLETIIEVPTGGGISEYSKLTELMGIQLPDPDSLMRLQFKPVVERLGRTIALSGEAMDDLIYQTPEDPRQFLNQTIVIAGGSYYRDVHWQTPFNAIEKTVNGLRTDVMVLRLSFEKDILTLLFEAEKIPVEERSGHIFVDIPKFYHLIGVDWTSHPPEELLEAIANLLEGRSLHHQLDIYTLKIDLP